jgi:hypothetical protein
MAATIVTIESALQILTQIIPLIQNAVTTGQAIDAATWADAITIRDAALDKLDADIAAKGKSP